MELWATLDHAKSFFKSNPNWLEDQLEPAPPSYAKLKAAARRKKRRKKMDAEQEVCHNIPLLPMKKEPLTNIHLDKVAGEKDKDNSAYLRVNMSIRNRQNSLPLSLCNTCNSHIECLQLPQANISRCVDSFPTLKSSAMGEEMEESGCLLCQQAEVGWGKKKKVTCPMHQSDKDVNRSSDCDDSDFDLDNKEGYSGSKSLPSAGLAKSQTSSIPHLPSSLAVVEGFTNDSQSTFLHPQVRKDLSHSRTILHAEVLILENSK